MADLDLTQDTDLLADQMASVMQGLEPGWVPTPTGFTTRIFRTSAYGHAAMRYTLTQDFGQRLYRGVGAKLGVQQQEASAATVDVTVTLTQPAATTLVLPAGFLFALDAADGTQVTFAIRDAVTFPQDAQTAVAGALAQQTGAVTSGLSGTGRIQTSSLAVQSVQTIGQSVGGADAETDDAYGLRLDGELQLVSVIPLTPGQVEIYVARYPAVGRVLIIDNYVPDGETAGPVTGPAYGIALATTIAVASEAGEPIGSAKTQIASDLSRVRGQDYNHYLVDPSYTTVDVQASVVPVAGVDPDAAAADATAAIASFLSPANFARPTSGNQLASNWTGLNVVRLYDLIALVEGVETVEHIVPGTLQQRAAGGSFAAADVSLPGPAPLTRPGDIAISGVAS